MQQSSSFSADDRSRLSSSTDQRTIGELNTSYRTRPGIDPENVKRVAVRDASGSYTEEEPVHAFMVPSEYLRPNSSRKLPPKRPLGQAAPPEPISRSRAVPLYSQVATFGMQPRIRRQRTMIPVRQHVDVPWTVTLQNTVKLIAALAVAGLLFIGDKVRLASQYASQKLQVLPLVRSRTIYSAFRGARLERLGMRASRLRVVTPLAAVLVILGIGVFTGLVSDTFHTSHQANPASHTAQQSSNGAGAAAGAKNGNSEKASPAATPQNTAANTQQGGGRGSGTAGAAPVPPASSGGGANTSPTTSGGTGGSGGLGGGGIDPGGVTIPSPVTTPTLPVTIPSLPPVSVPQPPNDITQTLDNAVQGAPEKLNDTVQQAPQILNDTVQSAPTTLNSTVQSVPPTVDSTVGNAKSTLDGATGGATSSLGL